MAMPATCHRLQIKPRFYCTNILPVGFFMGLTLWSGNAVYLHLTVAFIQMLKVRLGRLRGRKGVILGWCLSHDEDCRWLCRWRLWPATSGAMRIPRTGSSLTFQLHAFKAMHNHAVCFSPPPHTSTPLTPHLCPPPPATLHPCPFQAFTPVITMLALFIAGLEVPNKTMILSVLVIAAGTALAAYGEVSFSALGVLIMFVSESAEAIRLVMTQYLLVGLKMGPFEGVMYLAPACFLWLTFGGALMEWRQISETGALSIAREHWLLFVAAACMGFMINLLAFATIKLASSLTLKVLGTVKNALLILAAMALYGEVVTSLQAWGYVLSSVAFGFYTYYKVHQIAASGDKS